ncbi:hypothetical protein [Spirosoma aerophilum]
MGWFQWRIRVPASTEFALSISQIGASEVFWDGKLLQRYGIMNE